MLFNSFHKVFIQFYKIDIIQLKKTVILILCDNPGPKQLKPNTELTGYL